MPPICERTTRRDGRHRSLIALVALVFLFTVASANGQTVSPAKLKVRGIGLDSTYAQVVRTFGRPVKDGKATREECIGGREKEVEYRGLSFSFMDGDSRDKKTFEVKSFSVTSGNWVVSGLKIGDSEAAVRRVLGRKFKSEPDADTGGRVWSYEIGEREGPGWTTIYFKNGRVTQIFVAYQVC